MSAHQESATARLGRLLTLVPWLLDHQGVPVEDAARTFGVTAAQLEADLSLLFLCGTPGHLPDDLIEADWEEGRIFLGNAESLAAPWRFTLDEALTLMVGLRALSDAGGLTEHDAIERALSKLETAAGAIAASASSRMRVDMADDAVTHTLATVSEALRARRRLHLTYLVPSRDESTERDVDPMRLVSIESRWYLEAWCHRAEAVRLFRLDRVTAAAVLDEPSAPPAEAPLRDLQGALYVPGPSDCEVVLDTDPAAAWVGEYYPVQSVTDLADGTRRVVLRTADPAWVVRLVWRLGGVARVVSPPEVADAVVRGALEALSAYAPQVLTT